MSGLFMFDGKGASSKKKVSLGGKGSKTQESKQDFLNRTRKEREEREAHRRREKAAERIQSFMIGRAKAVKHKGKEREGWDDEFAAMDSSLPSSEELGSLLRRLLYFYSPVPSIQGDSNRLTRLAIWLLDHTKEGRMQLLRGDYDPQSSLRCKRLCVLVLSRLRMAKCDNDSIVDAALLLKMCDAVTWGDGGADFAAMLVGMLVEQGLMSVSRAHFLVKDDGKLEQLMVLVCGLVARSLGTGGGEQSREIWRQYVLEVLCSLHVSKHVSKRCKEMLEFKGVWSSLLAILSAETGLIDEVFAKGVDPAGFLLSNLVEMSSERLSDSTPSETGAMAGAASRLLDFVCQAKEDELEDEDSFMDIDEDEDDVEMVETMMRVDTAAGPTMVRHRTARVKSRQGGPTYSPQLSVVRSYIKSICNRQYVMLLLEVLLKAPPLKEGAGGEGGQLQSGVLPQDFVVVNGTCSLLLKLIKFLPEAESVVLNALAFKQHILGMLADWVQITVPTEVAKSSGGTSLSLDALTPLLGVHTMFCQVYRHLLITVDEQEFYEGGYPFSLAQVREIVRSVRAVIFPLYFSKLGSMPEPVRQLRLHGTRLLTRLFERNCHREFLPRDEWHAHSRHVAIVTSQLDGFLALRLHDPNAAGEQASILDASMSNVLSSVPFSLPFDLRVRVLRQLIHLDKEKLNDAHQSWVRVTINRAQVVPDSFDKLYKEGRDIKHTVQIAFVSGEGGLEAGIDGGGLFKEFLNQLCHEAFVPSNGLFCTTPDGLLFPNPQAKMVQSWAGSLDYLQLMEFLGRIVGKAIYDGILIELRLAPFFLRRMLGKEMYFDDLKSLDADLYKNLCFVKNYEGDVEELGLFFAVDEDLNGEKTTFPLIPGGAEIPVTREKFVEYKNRVSDYWLSRRIRDHSDAFMKGLSMVMELDWLRMFSPGELQMIISGSVKPIDVDDLASHTVYSGGYDENHPTIRSWWNVLHSLENSDLELLLKFVTSCSRPPLLGFKELQPNFCIQKTSHTEEEADARLPTASTCMNLLKLPAYTNEEDLRTRLLYALRSNSGFELS